MIWMLLLLPDLLLQIQKMNLLRMIQRRRMKMNLMNLMNSYQLQQLFFPFLPIYFAPENNDFNVSMTPFCSVC